MNILIIGAGMYVTGREGSGVGTILSSLIQTSKEVNIDKITIVAKNIKNNEIVKEISKKINDKLATKVNVEYVVLSTITLDEVCKRNDFDSAIVCTPDHLHFEQIKILFNNNIHALSVKPLVSTVEEHKELIQLQEKNNLLGMVEFHKRYDEANLYTKKIISENNIGDILYYSVDYSQKISIPTSTFKNWISHTNIFQYLGVHYIDLFYFITNFKPLKVMAYGTNGILKSKGIDAYDSIHASVIWKGDNGQECISVLNTNWIDPDCTSALSDQKYKIVGTGGRIENDHKNRGIEFVSDGGLIQHPNPYFSEYTLNVDNDYDFVGYGHMSIRQFILDVRSVINSQRTVESFERTRPTFKQTLVSTYIVEAVNRSINNNSQWEYLDV
jgi:D-galacturonate reductase